MTEQLTLFETAKLAKEKGFNGMCINRIHYSHFHTIINNVIPKNISIVEDFTSKPEDWNHKLHNNPNGGKKLIGLYLSIPTQSLLQKWLREVCNLNPYVRKTKDNFWKCFLETTTENSTNTWWSKDKKTYEEALEQGLIEALNLIP